MGIIKSKNPNANSTDTHHKQEFLLSEKLLLKGVHHVEKINRQLECSGGKFNIFELFNIEHKEVATHSLMLQKIFEYSDSKIKKNKFLDLFIEMLNLPAEENWISTREKQIPIVKNNINEGRIDFWIESKKANLCVALEMKIHATDQPEQLKRYAKYAQDYVNQPKNKGLINDYRIVYLTLDGHMPSQQSLGDIDLEKFINISYKNEIIAWLDECINLIESNSAQGQNIYSALLQYKNACENLVKENENMDLVKSLQSPENYIALQQLKEAEKKVNQKLIDDFWNALKNKFKSKLKKDFEFDKNAKPEHFYKKSGATALFYKTNHTIRDNRRTEYNLYVYVMAYNKKDFGLYYGICIYSVSKEKYGDVKNIPTTNLEKYNFRNDFFEYNDYGDDLGWNSLYSLEKNERYIFNDSDGFSPPVIAMLDEKVLNAEVERIVEKVSEVFEELKKIKD